MAANAKKDRLDTLVKEYLRVCTEIQSMENNNEKIVGLAIAIISAGFVYGLGQHIKELFFAVPLGFDAVILFNILQYYRILRYGGYKASIENRINEILGTDILVWERLVSSQRRLEWINSTLGFIYLMIAIVIHVYSLKRIHSEYGQPTFWVFLCIIAVVAIGIALGFSQLRKIHKQSFSVAEQLAHGAKRIKPA